MTNNKIKLFAILIMPIALQAAGVKDYNKQLLVASQTGNLDLVREALANGANVDFVDADYNSKDTPLHNATWRGHTEIVKALILAKATIDARNNLQDTPLHSAAKCGKIDAIALLINAKATIDASNNDKVTPLNCAASLGYVEIVNALIKAGASIDSRDNNQETPLHGAARKNIRIVNLLILAKATIDAKNNDQETPLHLAAKYCLIETFEQFEVVKKLLDVGSNSRLLNRYNKTIFDSIRQRRIKQKEKDNLEKIIKDHQKYQSSMLIELPKLFADQQNQLKIPEPIAKLITQYAFGICETEKNNKGENHDKQ